MGIRNASHRTASKSYFLYVIMAQTSNCPVPDQPSLNWHLRNSTKAPDDLRHLISDVARSAKYISYAIQTTDTGLSGNTNSFGEDQLKLDELSDDVIRENLCENGTVCCYISEEKDDVIELDPDGKFTIVFDPLDGSSLVDANFSIGSIFGIYEGGDIIGKTPRDQVAALYVLYGPRTLLVYSCGNGTGVHEFILNDVGEFKLLRSHMGVADEAKNYSPGNLRAVTTNKQYNVAVEGWMADEKTLRYSGCMVADIHHILSKGQGIFSNIGGGEDSKYPDGKLRHVFECGPFAYLVEEAGGLSSDGVQSILDKKITDVDQRTAIIIGSKNEVEKTVGILSA